MILNPKIHDITFTKLMGLDLETTGLEAWNDEIDLIALKNERGVQFVLETAHYNYEELCELFTRLLGYTCIGHNIKFDVAFIWYHYKVLLTNIHCTMDTARILENGYQTVRDFDLAAILLRYLGVSHAFAGEKSKLQKSFTNKKLRDNLLLLPQVRTKQISYAVADVDHLIDLYHKQMEFVHLYSLNKIYKLEHTVLPVLAKMEVRGCLIDVKKWREFIDEHWRPELKRIQKQIDDYLGVDRKSQTFTVLNLFNEGDSVEVESDDALNYASSAQILNIFKEAGEPTPKNKEGKESVDETTLSIYLTENPDSKLGPLVALLLKYREYKKLITTYGESFLAQLDRNGYIHCGYTQTRTETGRISSVHPNLQNLPSSTEEDKDVRRCFIAPEGYDIVTCDMDAAEVRIAADLSQDKLLVDAIEQGVDMHSKLGSVTYSIIFKKPIIVSKSKNKIDIEGVSYVLKELRDNHKTGLFAKMYKGGAKRMYAVFSKYINAHWPPAKRQSIAKQISDALDNELPQLSTYLDRLIQEAQRTGRLISDKLGRIRYFKQDVYGEAANYPVQGICANAQKVAMIKIDEYLETIGGWLIINQHDETVSVVPTTVSEEAAQQIKTITSEALSWFLTRIKGDASVSVNKFWKK